MSWVEMKARGLRQEAEGILAVELCMADASPLPFTWAPGAHVDVQLGGGVVRQYSLTNLADEGCLRLAVKHADASRGGSRWLHQQLRLGDRLQVSAPRNLFPLQPGNGPVLLVAAGIGVTPLLAMYRQCRAQQRPVQLLYFARSASHSAFVEQLSVDPQVRLVNGLAAEQIADYLNQHLPAWAADSQLYTCGPDGFMGTVQRLAAERGWPQSAVFQEHFQAPALLEQVAGVQLEFVRSGKQVQVLAGETLVAAAERVGVSIATSCGMGMCGACMTAVVSGEVEHRDQYLSDAERASGKWVMPCVSGCSAGVLVLDC